MINAHHVGTDDDVDDDDDGEEQEDANFDRMRELVANSDDADANLKTKAITLNEIIT